MATDWLTPAPTDRIFHVRPDGDLPTLAAARDAIRALPPAPRAAQRLRVLVHAGTYELAEPFGLGPEDSGVIYQAAPGERPLVSGGTRLTGFAETEVDGLRAWTLDLPAVREGDWTFTQLYVDGRRCPRPRLPETGYYHLKDAPATSGERASGYHPGDLEPWHNIEDVDVVLLHYWIDSHVRIERLDPDTVTFVTAPHRPLDDELHEGRTRYFVENVREALGTPGQWYLDRPEGTLVYLPLPHERLETTTVVAPRLDCLVRVTGTGEPSANWSNPGGPAADGGFPPDRPGMRAALGPAPGDVHDVHFVGLDWAYTEYDLPPGKTGDAQAAYTVPAAIQFEYCRDCSLRLNRMQQLGGWAIEAGDRARDVEIVANRLDDLGGGGVRLMHGSNFCTVSDNRITRGGRRFPAAIGIWLGHSGDNVVVYNHIRDFYYTGISLGWVWGYRPSRARRNRIEYNRIEQIGQGVLSDMGGIYSLGVAPGTRICANWIADVRCYGYGGNGLYPDEGTSFVLYEDNFVAGVDSGSIAMNYGRDCLFRNNLLLDSRDVQVRWGTPAHFRPFVAEGNVVVWRTGSAVQGGWFAPNSLVEFHANMWWQRDGKEPDFGGHGWAHWQQLGYDTAGRVVDPLLADDTGASEALRADSPALAAGFRAPRAAAAGPRADVLTDGRTRVEQLPVGPFVWTEIAIADTGNADRKGEAKYTAYPQTAPCSFTVNAVCENAGDAPFHGEVTFAGGGAETRAVLDLAPGERAVLALPLDVPADTDAVVVRTASDAPGYHGSVLALMFRPTVRIPRLPADLPAAELPARLAAAPAIPVRYGTIDLAVLRLGVGGDCLLLTADVRDNPVERLSPIYKGSMIDLFGMEGNAVDMGGQAHKAVGQVFLAPGTPDVPARLATATLGEIPGSDIHFEPRPGGYRIAARIPLAALSLSAEAGELPFKAGVYAHAPGAAGILRAHTFNELSRLDPHAYGRLVIEK